MDNLINLESYTPFELAIFATGCYLWVLVYVIYVKNIIKHKFVEMPVFAACSNIAWEFVWGWVPPSTDMGLLLVWAYRIWFLVDIFIFYGVLQYGAVHVSTPALRQHFRPLAIVTAILWGLVYYFFKEQGFDTSIGANSAYVAQILISILYIILILREHKLLWFSYTVAWLRMIGTGLISVFMVMHYPENSLLLTLAATSFVLDTIYIVLFSRRRATEERKNREQGL